VKKNIVGSNVFFSIEWSKFFKYDRVSAGRILPDMPGILQFAEQQSGIQKNILLFASWREGLRTGMKNIFDPHFCKMTGIRDDLMDRDELLFRYTVIDTSPQDMQDIFFWLLKSYTPLHNNSESYEDSGRFTEICVEEKDLR
jgi:hypothetical protein